jgi:hypothetical protein
LEITFLYISILFNRTIKNIVENVSNGRKKPTKYGIVDLEWKRYNAPWVIVVIREA